MLMWLLSFWFSRALGFFVIQTAQTNLRTIKWSEETNWAETPSTPTMTLLRTTGDTLAYKKNQVESKEIRQDRQVPSIIEVGVTTEGAVNIELDLGGTYDQFISAVLGNPWVVVALTGLTLTFAAAVSGLATITASATTGLLPGVWVQFGGTAITANNVGPFKISSVTSGTIVVFDPNGVITVDDVTAGTANARWVRNGVTPSSYLLEKNFTDITTGNAFIQYLGMRAVEMALNFKSQAILDGSISFWGKVGSLSTATVAGTVNQPNTAPSISASANIGQIYLDNANLAEAMKDLSVTLSNTPRHRPIIGSLYDADIGFGLFDVKVSGTALTPDLGLFNDVIEHSTVSIDLPCFDSLGNQMIITLPALKLEGNPDTPAANQDVDTKFTGMGFIDPLSGVMVQFDTITTPTP
jgi:hypothetical protein